MSDLHDVSTFGGNLYRIWHLYRWRFTILLAILLLGVLFGVSYIVTTNYLQQHPSEIPVSAFVLSGSKLIYYGNESKFSSRYLDPFPGLPDPSSLSSLPVLRLSPDPNSPPNATNPLLIDTIEIKWVRISGPNFTSSLSQYASSLRVLHLDNVTIESHLQSQELPFLQEFFLSQGLEPEERNLPDYLLNKGPTPWLLSTLFFIPDPNPNMTRLSSLNATNDLDLSFISKAVTAYTSLLNITIFLKGSITYQLNPLLNEVRLDISNCSSILKALPQSYKLLTLGRCRDLTPSSISPSVTFLNFYIVYLDSDLLSKILRNLPKLQEFYAEIPDRDVEVRLDDFSQNLRLLSISSMRIIPGNSTKGYPGIKEFYFGSENQYGWLQNRVTKLNQTLYKNFSQIFPLVEKVGLFDLKDEDRYIFLSSVLKSESVRYLVVENFLRGLGPNLVTAIGPNFENYEVFQWTEQRLDDFLLGKGVGDFVVEFVEDGKGGRRAGGRKMDGEEKLWLRFIYLGWCPIDSWNKYLYVQRVIGEGGILI